jgi:tRNA threonylcarbamoyladenosine modification (KEOPS) complex  Pcc1 subunit
MSQRKMNGKMKGKMKRKDGAAPCKIQKRAELRIGMEPGKARLVLKALSPETDDLPRARATISAAPCGLRLRVTADDTGALRAAINSYMRWIKISLDVGGLMTRN